MTTYIVEIDQSIEAGKEEMDFVTLQDAWDEFINQVAIGQLEEEDKPKSKYANDGLMVRLWVEVGYDRFCIFQYDDRYGTNNMSLTWGQNRLPNDEAIISKYDLMDIEF